LAGLLPSGEVIGGEYFGRGVFGSIQGRTLGIITIGAITEPIFTGMLDDIYQSYRGEKQPKLEPHLTFLSPFRYETNPS
jgi:hypothetical protein